MRNHFNKGNAFGTIMSVKSTKIVVKSKKKGAEDKEVPCVDIIIDCNSGAHGRARCYGRIWGGAKSKAFLDTYKSYGDQVVKVEGFYSQFTKDGTDEVLSNFAVYKYELRKNETPRAGFILTGELKSVEEAPDGEKLLMMSVNRDRGESGVCEEEFRLYLHPKDAKRIKSELKPGEVIAIKGLICQMGEKDYISDEFEGDVKPYIKDIAL